ncbi:hypothetical protein TEA_011503 [Camellia sinensis var. sinensis]|uniref:Sacsin/Nov domain-containing protein n=1 Tax=Camellia sinensis var. sinensis TaxID=542762 RepID=A0A4S4EW07_CAMSN|nr:hypothetical protein TEA_011503 [Camellia sinensis var. sinensis]
MGVAVQGGTMSSGLAPRTGQATNAEDNEYREGVQPSLEFVITSRDITATGASATLLVFNNERGFSPKNVESICSIGRSTKKGHRKRGYIGEKGIGFKSVFLITAQPYIFSNGYQIRFNEQPCPECKVGYIVPEWVNDNPTLSTIKEIYGGSDSSLPTTTIVLPLKPDKVQPVKQQLSTIHPEILLFLSKIKRLSVKEDNEDPRLNTVSAVSISSDINFATKKNIDADSFLLHLSANEHGKNSEEECSYHMWRQRFPVRQENKVEKRMEVDEWVITLAFPNGQRLNRGRSSPGVYAFLPTEMVTNFPFIIQADFLLASSRETILLDNKWNQGILDCVPSAFVSAFISLVKSSEDAPIRFNEQPCPQCKVGYIVPEWVDDNPTLSTIKEIYGGSGSSLPTTTIVLPLKPDKVQPVKQQLSTIHPEILLFLSKIKRLSVKEDNEDPSLNTVSAVSISSEINFATKKNIDADSFLLHLSADEHGKNSEEECSYHMWRQRFPVRQENKVEKRMEVDEWVITLAFPNGQRLNRGRSSPGIYAFLPTEMVTNFPFIIQADFLLASSRETILLDNKWNQGILDCVPSAFVSAFISLVKSSEDAPVSSLPRMFGFIPVNSSPYPALNAVRETIKAKLVDENIVPCQSYLDQKIFQKPTEVGRLMPAFWDILKKARKEGLGLYDLLSHRRFVLSCSFDREQYDPVLNFLGVKHVEDEWYARCIPGSNLVLGVSDELYLELLLFLAKKWRSNFLNTNILCIPLLKYASLSGNVSLYSVNEVQRNVGKVLVSGSLIIHHG